MKTIRRISLAISIGIVTISFFGCSAVGDQLNSGLKKEMEEAKLINLGLLAILGAPAPAPAPSTAPTTAVSDVVDNNDGTVFVKSQNLTWAKCSQNSATANLYSSAAKDCSNGTIGAYTYCSTADDKCNNQTDPKILNGDNSVSSSSTHNNCHLLTYYFPGKVWRVPTITELYKFYRDVYTANASLFPGTMAGDYWSANSVNAGFAFSINFSTGKTNGLSKTSTHWVRCVATGQ